MRWTLLLSLSAAVTLAAGKVSTNARCGNAYNALPGGMTCKSSKWGDCCSQYGYCGKTKDYCGTGCQSSFGTCNGVVAPARTSTTSSRGSTSTSTRTASSTGPSATSAKVKVTTNARCGNSYGASPAGMTCSGGKYGDCCSQYSYCGSGSAYCGTGCQAGFGKCDTVSSSASSSAFGSSSPSSSSASSSSPAPLSTFTSETTISTSSSSSLPSDSSTSTSISISSSESSTVSVTSTEVTSTTPSSTPSPSSSAVELCGVEGTNTVGIRVLKNTPLTTIEDCLAQCLAESTCVSFMKYPGACILAEVPLTPEIVIPKPGTGLIYYNRDCVTSALAATAPPTTLATSTSTSTTTPSPSPSTAEFCGTKAYIKDSLGLSTFTSIPFTTPEECLASCRAESRCGSIMFFNDGCYLNEAPITTANVDLGPGSALTFYNRECGISAPATTAPPTTLATSTTSPTPSPSPSPSPAEFCALEGVGRVNLRIITSSRFTTVDDCLAKCRANSECGSIMVRNSESCSLTIIPIDSTNVSPRPGSILRYWNRDCGTSASTKPVKRGEEEKGSDKSVSIAKWTQGKQGRQRGPKDT